MGHRRQRTTALLACLWLACGTARGAEPPVADGAYAALAARCASCHDQTTADAAGKRVKGKFGHVLDLGRLGTEDKYVVPGNPAASELWLTIENGEMPPVDAKTGRLTSAEREAIRAWIAAGAPARVAPTTAAASEATVAPPTAGAGESGVGLLTYIGRAHVLAVHLPIGLLVGALVAELLALAGGRWPRCAGKGTEGHGLTPAALHHAGRLAALAGAGAAIVAAGLGLLLWYQGTFVGERGEYVLIHLWTGVGTAVLAGCTAAAVIRVPQRLTRARRATYVGLLVLTVVLTAVAGHYGGVLVHGSDYLPVW